MQDALIEIGWICSIISEDEINSYIKKNNPNHFFLFFFTQQINKNVVKYKRYILYQLEQNINNRLSIHYSKLHENNILKKIYDNARLLFDYSQVNINVIKQYYNHDFKIINIPARNIQTPFQNKEKEYIYDIIFIGSMNKRRENILCKLKEKYKVLIIENIYGEELKYVTNAIFV
jgi:hypothetical protein